MVTLNKTQDLNYTEDINKLLCEIDTWLSDKAHKKLDGDRYGQKVCINQDDFKIVSKYRKIFLDKAQNHCCLRDVLIDDIILRIKQLLNRNQK